MQIFLAAISKEAIVSSFTAFALAPGALKTGTPLSLIASTGILFTPAPEPVAVSTADGDAGVNAPEGAAAAGPAAAGPAAAEAMT